MAFDINLFVLILVCVFSVIFFAYDYYERKTGVPTYPTMPAVRRKMVEILKKDFAARNASQYKIMDLGSGSGQLSWRIARAMPEAKVVGIEISYVPWLRSVLRQKLFGPANLEYKRLDFWAYDISDIDAMITYLPGTIMDRVGEKLRKELRSDALIIANGFALGAEWKPYETMTVRVPFKMSVFLYRKD